MKTTIEIICIIMVLFIFFTSCKKDDVINPIIPPIQTTDSISVHFICSGDADNIETTIQMNDDVILRVNRYIDTTMMFMLNDTLVFVCSKTSGFAVVSNSYCRIIAPNFDYTDNDETSNGTYHPARIEYVIK